MKRTIFLTILLLNLAGLTFANPHNLLPRFPEIIIQQGMTENYAADSLTAIATIQDNYAHTVVNTDLRNISQTKAFTSVKFRILYPKNLSSIKIKINGSDFNYTPERNTYNFWLNPNEAVNFHIEANVSINYSINAVRKALKEEEKAKKNIKTTFAEDFAAYFNTEKYGKRFMTGNIVSKWGIFPLSIKKLEIAATTPPNMILVSENNEVWNQKSRVKQNHFYCNDSKSYNSAVFVPEKDKEDFLETQKILNSKKFIH
jgi:hypothetical protein